MTPCQNDTGSKSSDSVVINLVLFLAKCQITRIKNDEIQKRTVQKICIHTNNKYACETYLLHCHNLLRWQAITPCFSESMGPEPSQQHLCWRVCSPSLNQPNILMPSPIVLSQIWISFPESERFLGTTNQSMVCEKEVKTGYPGEEREGAGMV